MHPKLSDEDYRLLVNLKLLASNDSDWPKTVCTLYALSNAPETHYRRFLLRKSNGKQREILAPDYLLKSVQRRILVNVLSKISISPYAMAYHPGATIAANAEAHCRQPLVLKLDIADFFGNISFLQVYCAAFGHLPSAVATLLTNLCCYREHLPQGAPTSPAIANIVLTDFDYQLSAWCTKNAITYTRYCDDLVFSGDFAPKLVEQITRKLLAQRGFMLNPAKKQILPQSKRQIITGVVVNQKLQVSRHYRRRLRQEIYYCQKFGVREHLERTQNTRFPHSDEAVENRYWRHLLGQVNFVLQINPDDGAFVQAREAILKQLTL